MKNDTESCFLPNRRQVLEGAGAVAGVTLMSSSLARTVRGAAAAPTAPTLIVVFLRGGADALSWVAPVTDTYYQQRRPTLAVPVPGTAGAARWLGPTPATSQGLALPESVLAPPGPNLIDVFQDGHLTFAAGTALQCVTATGCVQAKSHFEAMGLLETGNTPGGSVQASEGWLSRYLGRLGSAATVQGLTHGALQVRSLAEAPQSPAVPDVADYPFPGPPLALAERRQHYADLNVTSAEPSAAYLAAASASVTAQDLLAQINHGGGQQGFPATPFGEALRKTANILLQGPGLAPVSLRPDVVHIDYGSWDHHKSQGTNPPVAPTDPSQFYLQSLDVSQALGAFYQAMGKDAGVHRYHLVVVSEFGRRAFENGDKGTDHGAGGVAMFMGDGVQAGNFSQSVLFPGLVPFDPVNPTTTGLRSPGLLDNPGTDDEDLATGIDIRELLGEVLLRRTSLSSADVFGNPTSVFPTIAAPALLPGIVG